MQNVSTLFEEYEQSQNRIIDVKVDVYEANATVQWESTEKYASMPFTSKMVEYDGDLYGVDIGGQLQKWNGTGFDILSTYVFPGYANCELVVYNSKLYMTSNTYANNDKLLKLWVWNDLDAFTLITTYDQSNTNVLGTIPVVYNDSLYIVVKIHYNYSAPLLLWDNATTLAQTTSFPQGTYGAVSSVYSFDGDLFVSIPFYTSTAILRWTYGELYATTVSPVAGDYLGTVAGGFETFQGELYYSSGTQSWGDLNTLWKYDGSIFVSQNCQLPSPYNTADYRVTSLGVINNTLIGFAYKYPTIGGIVALVDGEWTLAIDFGVSTTNMTFVSSTTETYLQGTKLYEIKDNVLETYDKTSIIEMEFEESLIPGEEFTLGIANAAKVSLKLNSTETIVDGDYFVCIRFNKTGFESSEWLQLGKFYLDNKVLENKVYTLTLFDKLVYSQQKYETALSYPHTMQAAFEEIATSLNLALDTSVVIDAGYEITAPILDVTTREMLGYIASANASICRVNREGKLAFVTLTSTPSSTLHIATSNYFTVKQLNPLKTFDTVKASYNVDNDYYTSGTGADITTLKFINYVIDQSIADDVKTSINGFNYMPITMDWRCFPQYEIGDTVTFYIPDKSRWIDMDIAWQDCNLVWNGENATNLYSTTILTNKLSYKGGLKATITAPSLSEQNSGYTFNGSLKTAVQVINKTDVKQGTKYYGASFSKTDGLVVERTDKESRLIANGDVFSMQVKSGGGYADAVYFDTNTKKYKFNGTLEAVNGTFSGALSGGTIAIGTGNSIFKADSDGIYLGNATFASAPFRVSPAGFITSTSGSIGNWTISDAAIFKDTGTRGTSCGMLPTSYPFYAGEDKDHASIAPFRVTPEGKVTCSDMNITGGSIKLNENVYIGDKLLISKSNFAAGIAWSTFGEDVGGLDAEIYLDPSTHFLHIVAETDPDTLIQGGLNIHAESGVSINNFPVATFTYGTSVTSAKFQAFTDHLEVVVNGTAHTIFSW